MSRTDKDVGRFVCFVDYTLGARVAGRYSRSRIDHRGLHEVFFVWFLLARARRLLAASRAGVLSHGCTLKVFVGFLVSVTRALVFKRHTHTHTRTHTGP